MLKTNRTWYVRGLRDGLPICFGYLAVGFTLGIAAKNAGLSPFQAFLASLLNNASAGEFAAFTLIAAGASLGELAVMELIANARYMLMSFALGQKLEPGTGTLQRVLLGYDVTDELFGISIAVPGRLNPWYTFGGITVALPGWSLGTLFGCLSGNVLPARALSALSVGLYGMFIACIIPPARKDRIVAGLIVLCFAVSWAFNRLPCFAWIPSGTKIILLTVALAAGAAALFPVKDEPAPQRPGADAQEVPHGA